MNNKKIILALVLLIFSLLMTKQASAVDLADPTTTIGGVPVAFQYGDFYSYSLPISQYLFFGDTHISSGDYYYIASDPGALRKDDIVLATGAGGNFNSPWADFTKKDPSATMDQPYATPNPGGANYFRTGDATSSPEPAPGAGQFAGDTDHTWDTRLSSLNTYLNGRDLIIFFNNNQTSESESLYAWGQVVIKDDAGVLPDLRFDFTNIGATISNPIPNPGFTSPALANNNYPPTLPGDGTYPQVGDFVLSGGKVIVNGITFNHNLGANNAAYAIFSPELNDIVHNYGTNGNGYDVFQADIRLTSLNNGYEQAFIQGGRVGVTPPPIPEPSSLFLLGGGLIGLTAIKRKKAA